MENTPLDERAISGITAKQLVIYMGGVISILITLMATYYSLKTGQEKNADRWESLMLENKILREDFKTMQSDLRAVQFDLRDLKAAQQYSTKNSKP